MGVRLHKSSLRVTYVESNSPLQNKVFAGDQLVALDAQPIKTIAELTAKLAEHSAQVTARFRRGFFSYCEHQGTTVERLQLDKDVFRTTGRAVEMFTVYLILHREMEGELSGIVCEGIGSEH